MNIELRNTGTVGAGEVRDVVAAGNSDEVEMEEDALHLHTEPQDFRF